MKHTKTIWIGIVAVVAVSLVVGVLKISSGRSVSPSETVRIGAALALTGDAASWGEMEKKGIELRLSQLKDGKIDGKKVEISFEDTRSTSAGTISAVQKLVSVDGVKYIIGPTWLDSYPGIQGLIKDNDVLVITPSASATAIQQPDPVSNLFSTWYRTDALTNGFAEYISGQRYSKVAVLFQNDSYYAEFIEFIKKDLGDKGVNLGTVELLNPGQFDTKTLLLRLKSEGVEAIVFGAYDEKLLANFLRDQKNIMPNAAVFSGDAVRGYVDNPDFAKLLEGTVFFENSSPSPVFAEEFFKRYSAKPTLSASTAYDATDIFLRLIAGNDTVSGMVQELKSSSFDTRSFGTVSFDGANGVSSRNRQYQVNRISNGLVVKVQ